MLLHLPVGLSSHQTAQRRLSGAHNDRSQSHRQWLAVTAPAGRAHAVERVEATCRREPRCCQTKQVPKKGVEGRRRDARRRPKKLRFISRGKKALAHPSLLPLIQGDRISGEACAALTIFLIERAPRGGARRGFLMIFGSTPPCTPRFYAVFLIDRAHGGAVSLIKINLPVNNLNARAHTCT